MGKFRPKYNLKSIFKLNFSLAGLIPWSGPAGRRGSWLDGLSGVAVFQKPLKITIPHLPVKTFLERHPKLSIKNVFMGLEIWLPSNRRPWMCNKTLAARNIQNNIWE